MGTLPLAPGIAVVQSVLLLSPSSSQSFRSHSWATGVIIGSKGMLLLVAVFGRRVVMYIYIYISILLCIIRRHKLYIYIYEMGILKY